MPHAIHDAIPLLEATLRRRSPGQPPFKSFVRWYAEARYGGPREGVNIKYLDGSGDGGADAFVQSHFERVLIQSKYSSQALETKVPTSELMAFNDVVRHLRGDSNEVAFNAWIGRVTSSERRSLYRDIRNKAVREQAFVRFVFVTTRRHEARESLRFRVEDRDEVAHLWSLYDEALGPPFDDLELKIKDPCVVENDGVRSLVGRCDITDILRAMHEARDRGVNPMRLFAQNIRSHLGNTPVNREIVASYRKDPARFWLRHNGLYLVTPKWSGDPSRPKLSFPSVVNGAQTLYSLLEHVGKDELEPADVVVRILETANRYLRDSVIGATNSQNTMNKAALLAHHDALPEVSRRLDNVSVFLERQQKSWSNLHRQSIESHEKITVKDLLQWVQAVRSVDHLGALRSKVSEFLDRRKADPILKSLAGSTGEIELRVAVAAGLTARNLWKRMPKHLKGKAQVASVVFTHILAGGIGRTKSGGARARHVLSTRGFSRHEIPKTLVAVFRDFLEVAIKREKATGDGFSNYFKRDDYLAALVGAVKTKKFVRDLGKAVKLWGVSVS